jgi:putative ABC transport system permease protein
VVRVTTARALVITIAGIAIGAGLAFGAGRLMESLLYGLVSTSLAQLGALVAVLAITALVAAYVPARRASRIDPMTALRES